MTARILKWMVYLAAAISASIFVFIISFILVNGIPHITPSLFEWEYNSDNVSLMPALIDTLLMAVFALLISVPVGVASAIYLVEYASPASRYVRVVRMTTETLQGIPSIVYGLFGLLFFTTILGWGLSLISGAFTLAIMVLPIIMRTTEEALLAVPPSYKQGGLALGAGTVRTIFRCVLPTALPGIFGGLLLAFGRCVGEVAALLFTAGTVAQVPDFAGQGLFAVFDSCRTLAVHMYVLASEGLHIGEAYATAVVLLLLVILLNAGMNLIASRFDPQNPGR